MTIGWVSNERPPFVKTFKQRVEASSRGFSKMSDEYFLIKRQRGSFGNVKVVKQFLSAKYEVFYINPAYLLLVVIF